MELIERIASYGATAFHGTSPGRCILWDRRSGRYSWRSERLFPFEIRPGALGAELSRHRDLPCDLCDLRVSALGSSGAVPSAESSKAPHPEERL